MKTTLQNIMMATALTCALAATASATEYGQPVKEVEKEARSAVSGTVEVGVRFSGSNHDLAVKVAEAPAGKVLAIRWISAICQGPTGLSLGHAELWAASPYTDFTVFPMQAIVSRSTGYVARILSTPVFLNVKSGVGFYFRASQTQNIPGNSSCLVTYQGFLLDN